MNIKRDISRALKPIAFAVAAGVFIAVFYLLLDSSGAAALDENSCLSCHAKLDIEKTNAQGDVISLKINENDVNSGAHRYIDCTTCHTEKPHEVKPELTKLSSAEKCGTCHEYEYSQHTLSIHGQQLLQGNQDVATCVDCHSPKSDPHSVIRVLDSDAPTYKKNIAETCNRCHGDEELMGNYGIVEKVYESYMRSFHGKAIGLGSNDISQLDAATCTNCHGVHDIKSTNDSTSKVSGMDNMVKTCEQCHPGAGAAFAESFPGHKEVSPENSPITHVAENFFNFLLYSVVCVGLVVVGGATYKYTRNRWRRGNGNNS